MYVICAGHYGPHTGANKFIDEGTKNIQITDRVVKTLKEKYDVPVEKVPHYLDLGPSIEWVKQHVKQGAYAVEVHFNGSVSTSPRGVCTIYKSGDYSGRGLARRILRREKIAGVPQYGKGLYNSIEIASMRGWSDLGWHRYLYPTYHPVLVECAFVSNWWDALLFRGRRSRNKIADEIALAIYNHYKVHK